MQYNLNKQAYTYLNTHTSQMFVCACVCQPLVMNVSVSACVRKQFISDLNIEPLERESKSLGKSKSFVGAVIVSRQHTHEWHRLPQRQLHTCNQLVSVSTNLS